MMRWTGHVAGMEAITDSHGKLLRRPERKDIISDT
jgi:hypothetical protein